MTGAAVVGAGVAGAAVVGAGVAGAAVVGAGVTGAAVVGAGVVEGPTRKLEITSCSKRWIGRLAGQVRNGGAEETSVVFPGDHTRFGGVRLEP